MDKQPELALEKEKVNQNVELKQTVTTEKVKVTEETKLTVGEEDDESQKEYEEKLKQYQDQLKKWEEHVKKLNEEFANLLAKSQDIFEKQLSYISTGALGLSVGFIKDIVDIKNSNYKWMVVSGWGLLILTLLLNLISHMIAAQNAKKGKTETEDLDKYDERKINERTKQMENINKTTVGTMTGGIILIILFITINSIYGS